MTEPERRITWSFVAVVVVATLVFALQGVSVVKGRQLAKENRDRIQDIQRSRIESCQRTYLAFRLVFEPFLVTPLWKLEQLERRHRLTLAQRRELQFHRTILKLTRGCDTQTGQEDGRAKTTPQTN